jgi:hypothetical protein
MTIPGRLEKIEHATLRAWLNSLRDAVQAMTLVSAPGYRVNRQSGGQSISIDKASSKGGGGGAAEYAGPYTVVKKDDITVTVILIADDENYFQDSKIISGLTETDAGTDVDVTITVSGVVYADVIYSSGWVIAFANAAAKPAQVTDHIYIELAQVVFTDSKIVTIRQIQEGQIFPTQWGRIG